MSTDTPNGAATTRKRMISPFWKNTGSLILVFCNGTENIFGYCSVISITSALCNQNKNACIIYDVSLSEELAFIAFRRIPQEIRAETRYEPDNQLSVDLLQAASEMEQIVNEAVQEYRARKINQITEKILDLIGIQFNVES